MCKSETEEESFSLFGENFSSNPHRAQNTRTKLHRKSTRQPKQHIEFVEGVLKDGGERNFIYIVCVYTMCFARNMYCTYTEDDEATKTDEDTRIYNEIYTRA